MPTTYKIKFKGGTDAEWTADNPVLAARELGLETNTKRFKIGDGVTAWNSILDYASGTPGPAGTDGLDGADGADGLNGNGILSGDIDPTPLIGVDGDFYFNKVSRWFFGPKTAGVWGAGFSLGSGGGGGGSGLLNGTVDPTPGDGVDGEFWINTSSKYMFGPKAGGSWPAGFSLIGPTGPTGPAGSGSGIFPKIKVSNATGTAATDTSAIQTAINGLLDGETAFAGTGTYALSALHCTNFQDGVTFDGVGAKFKVSATAGSVNGWKVGMYFDGSKGASKALTGPIPAGTTVINLPAGHGLTTGMRVRIGSLDKYSTMRDDHVCGEQNWLHLVSGNVATLTAPTQDTYTTSPYIMSLAGPKRFKLRNIDIETDAADTGRPVPIILEFLEDAILENVTLDGKDIGRVGIYAFECWNTKTYAMKSKNFSDVNATVGSTEGYPAYWIGCEHVLVDGWFSEKDRHSQDFGGFGNNRGITRHAKVKNLVGFYTHSSFLSSHGGSFDVEIDGFLGLNCGGGGRMRGQNQTVKNGWVYGTHHDLDPAGTNQSYDHGLIFGEPAATGATALNGGGFAGYNAIVHNVIFDYSTKPQPSGRDNHGIWLYDSCKNVKITDCTFIGIRTCDIYSSGLQQDGITIRGCRFDKPATTSGGWPCIGIATSTNVSSSTTFTPLTGNVVKGIKILNCTFNDVDYVPIRIGGGFSATYQTIDVVINDISVPKVSGLTTNSPVVEFMGGFLSTIRLDDFKGVITPGKLYNAVAGTTIIDLRINSVPVIAKSNAWPLDGVYAGQTEVLNNVVHQWAGTLGNGYWSPIAGDPAKWLSVSDERGHVSNPQLGGLCTTQTNSAAGTGIANANAVAGRFGLNTLSTGTTTTGRTGLALSTVSILPSTNQHLLWEADFRVDTLPDATENFIVVNGFLNDVAAEPTTGLYFLLSTVSGNWRCIAAKASVRSNVDSGIAVVAGTFYRLRVEWDEVAIAAKFYIDGVLKATITTTANLPAAVMGAGVNIIKSAGSLARTLTVDRMVFERSEMA